MNTLSIPRQTPFLVGISILFGIAFVLTTALQWELVEFLTPFLVMPLLLAMWGALAVLLLVSVIYLAFRAKQGWRIALAPLTINTLTLLVVYFVPFTEIWLELQFHLNWNGYNEVARMVEEGRIQPDQYGRAQLPPRYRHLSRGGGYIKIDRSDGITRVFFFTFVGILDNFSGFMYRSDDRPPPPDDLGGDWHQTIRMRPHWFFCASC
jgi:hypothetical protein